MTDTTKAMSQTTNPNKTNYLMSSNLSTESMDKSWVELWQQIEIWYGDPQKRETAEALLNRIVPKLLSSHKIDLRGKITEVLKNEPLGGRLYSGLKKSLELIGK